MMAGLYSTIDASKAQAFSPADTLRIHGEIIAVHGSLDEFSAKLKLRLLLDPLSHAIDITTLSKRSGSDMSQWDFSRVAGWLHAAPAAAQDGGGAGAAAASAGSRVLCVSAGAGTGKSTISAALLSHPDTQPHIAAYHFLKYNDRRRLDMVRVVKSLAFQLAER